ncbi:MAG: glycerol-3-phosphate acyltransferase [Dehalococcoidia bacterium]
MDEFILIQKLLAAILVGYLLGSIPFAHIAARGRGVDIFATGSRRAGTANVFWNIGRKTGLLVLIADVAKGVLAVLIAGLLDVPGPVMILAGGAAVVGHWKSLFTGFKGGDGMATLVGVTLALVPTLALLGILVGLAFVALAWRSPYRSAWGIAACFLLLLGLSQYYQIERDLVLGLVVLASLVLFHNVLIHRRLSESSSPDKMNLDLDLDSDEDGDPDLGHTAPENR